MLKAGMKFLECQCAVVNHRGGIIGHLFVCVARSLHNRALQCGHKLLGVLIESGHFTKRINLAIILCSTDQMRAVVIVFPDYAPASANVREPHSVATFEMVRRNQRSLRRRHDVDLRP